MTETLTGAQILCRTLLESGVDVIFGYPGGAIMPFYHALASSPPATRSFTTAWDCCSTTSAEPLRRSRPWTLR